MKHSKNTGRLLSLSALGLILILQGLFTILPAGESLHEPLVAGLELNDGINDNSSFETDFPQLDTDEPLPAVGFVLYIAGKFNPPVHSFSLISLQPHRIPIPPPEL